MRRMNKKSIIFILITASFLVGCNNQTNNKNPADKDKAYLSITVTYDNNGVNSSNGMTSKVIALDIQNDCEQLVDEVEYTSQYPLAVYDANTQTVFFSADDKKGGDQLFSKNLETGMIEMLTDNLMAINNIIPTDKYIILNAVANGESILRPYIINRKTGEETKVEIYKDFSINYINLNPITQRLFVGGFLMSEDYDRVMEFNDILNRTKIELEEATFTLADGYLYELTENYQIPQLLLHLEQHGIENGVPSDENGNVYVELSSNGPLARTRPITESKIYDQKTQQLVDADTLEGLKIYPSYYTIYQNNAYILGAALTDAESSEYPRAIYRYNLADKTLTKIFQVDQSSFINNFTLLVNNSNVDFFNGDDNTLNSAISPTIFPESAENRSNDIKEDDISKNEDLNIKNFEVDITFNQPDEEGYVIADSIPIRAMAGSEIYFVENNKYKYITGGSYNYTKDELKDEILSEELRREECKKNGWEYVEMEKPKKGLRVTYADDGYIQHFYWNE